MLTRFSICTFCSQESAEASISMCIYASLTFGSPAIIVGVANVRQCARVEQTGTPGDCTLWPTMTQRLTLCLPASLHRAGAGATTPGQPPPSICFTIQPSYDCTMRYNEPELCPTAEMQLDTNASSLYTCFLDQCLRNCLAIALSLTSVIFQDSSCG